MKKLISVTLMAAASLLPLSASAQDNNWQRGDRGGDRGGAPRGDHQQRQAPAGGWQRQSAPQAQAPQAQPQAQQPRPQWNGGNRDQAQRQQWQGGRGGNGQRAPMTEDRGDAQRQQWNQRQQWAQPGQGAQPAQRPDGQTQQQGRWSGRDQARGDWRQQQQGNWQQARPDNNRGYGWQDRGNYQRDQQRRWNDQRDQQRRWNDQRDYGRDRYADNNRGQWSRDWRRDNRYDWNRYRYQNRQAFHLPRYYAPYGWDYGYRRFSIGMSLSAMLFSQDYWIDDPWSYRLPEVYGPYRWVRYYNDAVLVDIYSGQVVDVIYDIFW